MVADQKLSPDNLLLCENWYRRCLKLSQARTIAVCDVLGVKTSGLDAALLEARTIGITGEARKLIKLWETSENELAHAASLLELAQKIHQDKIFKDLDE